MILVEKLTLYTVNIENQDKISQALINKAAMNMSII